jgi:hypothetical protein
MRWRNVAPCVLEEVIKPDVMRGRLPTAERIPWDWISGATGWAALGVPQGLARA